MIQMRADDTIRIGALGCIDVFERHEGHCTHEDVHYVENILMNCPIECLIKIADRI